MANNRPRESYKEMKRLVEWHNAVLSVVLSVLQFLLVVSSGDAGRAHSAHSRLRPREGGRQSFPVAPRPVHELRPPPPTDVHVGREQLDREAYPPFQLRGDKGRS